MVENNTSGLPLPPAINLDSSSVEKRMSPEELEEVDAEIAALGEGLESSNKSSLGKEQLLQQQMTELQTEVQQKIGDAIIESHFLLQGQLLAEIKDSRGQLFLVLKKKGTGFDTFGGIHADKIEPEKVNNTFNWLKGRTVNDFHDKSNYSKNVVEERSA